jgi:hypothetical protein
MITITTNLLEDTLVPGVGDLMLASFPPADIKISHLISKQNPWYDEFSFVICTNLFLIQ